MSAERQLIATLLCPYGRTRRVLRGPARGMRFVAGPGLGVNYFLGLEGSVPAFWRRLVTPGMHVVDLGANRGQMTLLFARLVGPTGRITSVEPAPAEFRRLEENVALNRLSTVRLHRVAVSDRAGELAFAARADRPTQGKLVDVETTYESEGAEVIRVPARPLDELIARDERVDVIKIDIEGAGAVALKGAARILDEHRPVIYIELHGPDEQAGVRDALLSRGYVARRPDGSLVTDPTAQWATPLICRPEGARS